MSLELEKEKALALSAQIPEDDQEEVAGIPDVSETDPSPVQEGALGAIGMGAVEGTPFAKDVLSAGEALIEGGIDSFGERYNDNMEEWNYEINKAEEEHPVAFSVGDIGASFATMAVPGGSALKGAVTFGALSGLSRSEDRDFTDLFLGAGMGAAGYGVGAGIGKGMNAIGKRLGIFAREGVLEAAGGVNAASRKAFNKHAANAYMGASKDRGQALVDMADDVVNATADDGAPLLTKTFQSPDITATRASQAKNKVGRKIGKLLDKASAESKPLDGESLYHKIINKLGVDDASLSLVESKTKRDTLSELRKKVNNDFIKGYKKVKVGSKEVPLPDGGKEIIDIFESQPVFDDRSLKQLHQLKTELGEVLSSRVEKAKMGTGSASIADDMYLQQLGILSGILSESVEATGVASKTSFEKLNRQWSTLNLVEKMATDRANSLIQGPFQEFVDIVGTKGLIVGGLAHSAGMSKVASASLGIAFNKLVRSPSTPAALAKGVYKLSEFVKGNPDSRFVKRILVASALGADNARKAIEGAVAELNLTDNPQAGLNRTVNDVIAKSDDVLTALQYHNPEAASQLREAIKNEDADGIGAIMEEIAADPDMGEIIVPGQGWDGKTYNEENKQVLSNNLESMDISRRQKSELRKNLFDNNIIPQVNEEPARFFDFRKRDKSKPNY